MYSFPDSYLSYISFPGDYSVLSRVLCAILYLRVDYLFCLWKGVCANFNLLV